MYHVFKDRWLRDQDLVDAPRGREDPPELIEQCREYLVGRATGEHPAVAVSPTTDRKTKAELASAHVQASVRGMQAGKDVLRRLALAEATIDRLLAFVPSRAQDIGGNRLAELAEGLYRRAEELIPVTPRLRISISPELDLDALACHRVVLTIAVPRTFEADRFAQATTELHQWLGAHTSPEEYLAIRLLVEPDVLPD